MRTLSYRSKTRLKKALKLGLAVLGALLLLTLLFAVFLSRYVVYTPEGARLDFKRNTARDVELPTDRAAPPAPIESLEIEFADPGERNQETSAVSGIYDISTVDAVISHLRSHGFTMVARVKTFQDSNFALNHIVSSLRTAGGALWVGNGFYWLDPASDTVVAYLKQIARELAEKGFKEIVFDDFRFPNGTQIVYTSDKSRSDLIAGVATDLLNFFASSNITISFGNPNPDFALSGDSHVYLSGVTGSGVSAAVKGYSQLSDLPNQLVFLTGSKDRRFDDYQVLRPLLSKVVQ